MSSPSTVFIYEFFTGGGSPPGELPGGLATEALGMLWAVLADFRRWGALRTLAVLDPRFDNLVPGLSRATLPADEVVTAPPGSHPDLFPVLLERCQAAMVIAPETGGILASLTRQVETSGRALLGSSSSAATIAGNKTSCYKVFRKAKLSTPETHSVQFASASRTAKRMCYPIVLKPVDGIGCEGVHLVKCPSEVTTALDGVREATSLNRVILQSFVPGTHGSVSVLAAGNRCIPLSLNLQMIQTGGRFGYLGSKIPLDHPMGRQGVELACSAVNAIPGMRGYVGVDLVLAKDAVWLIEVNPRVTTSYIGLRQVLSANLAEIIWNACMEEALPESVPMAGQVVIEKDDPSTWGYQ